MRNGDDPRLQAAQATLEQEQERAARHRAHAEEVDRVSYKLLESFRALETEDPTIISGACAAIARFTANSIARQGQPPSVRAINQMLFRTINFSAEQVLLGPTREVDDDQAKGGPTNGTSSLQT